MIKIANHTLYFKQHARSLIEAIQGLAIDDDFTLHINDDGICLDTLLHGQKSSFQHSFDDPKLRQRASQKNQALLKACMNKQRTIRSLTDLTAGWGRDSFLLASHGLQVTLIEQHPLIFQCLAYLQSIAYEGNDPAPVHRMHVLHENSLQYLQRLDDKPDCLYLDPMFPAHKSSARPGKELQLLQLLTTNHDIQEIFELALNRANNRVVVKRPLHAENLGGQTPTMTYREKTIRFDVYLT